MALTQISTAGVKDDAVTAGKIPANAVGSSELADNAVDTAAIANDAVTSAKIADGTIVAANIANDTITATQLANNSANVNVIVDGAVTNAKLANDSVNGSKIAAGAINNANKLQDSIITGAKIGSGTITDGNLATNSVTTGKIANDAVTVDKVADDAIGVAQLSASGTASSSTFLRGDNSWTTVNTDLVSDTSPQLGGDLDTNGNHILLDDSRQLRLGDDNDMQINHTGSHAYIDNGTGHMYLRGSSNSQILLKPNGSDNSVRCMPGGAAELYHNGTKKFETASTGTKITGKLDFTGSGHLNGVNLGASQQLNLYHDANDAYFDNNVGDFYVRNDGNSTTEKVRIQAKGGEQSIVCTPNGAVELYHDNNKKLETSSAGGTLTGTWSGVGKVLQVKHKASGAKVSTTNTVTDNSFTSGAEVLSIAITPTVSTSVIHITGMLHFSHVSDYEGYWWLTYNHSGISESMIAGNANTSMRRTGLANSGGNHTSTMQPNSSVDLMFDHDTTNEITFKIRMATSQSGKSMNFNRNPADSTDTSDGGNPISSITVMELADVTITDDTVYRGT